MDVHQDPRAYVAATLGVVCFLPAVWLLWLGQPEALILLAIAGLCWWGYRSFRRA
jgi:hypothetical protein